tara:strand:- start:1851 stop:2057 length:207 start_codon:yes stop_codon:yes gene_type:complete
VRDALKGRSNDPSMASLLITYTLSSALSISPLEILKMPASLVMDLLYVHRNVEELKAEAMNKEMNKVK